MKNMDKELFNSPKMSAQVQQHKTFEKSYLWVSVVRAYYYYYIEFSKILSCFMKSYYSQDVSPKFTQVYVL